MRFFRKLAPVAAVLAAAGCATMANGNHSADRRNLGPA